MLMLLAELTMDWADPEVLGNYIEAGFWVAVGLIVGWCGRRTRPPFYRLPLLAAGLFVCFGLSDLVEAQTGAWWRPWWLLVWKGACILGLAWCYLRYRRIKQRSAASSRPGPPALPAG